MTLTFWDYIFIRHWQVPVSLLAWQMRLAQSITSYTIPAATIGPINFFGQRTRQALLLSHAVTVRMMTRS